MTLGDQIYSQALLLCGSVDSRQEALLRLLSRSAAGSLEARLRRGVAPEDCMADLVAAGSLYALAALSEADALARPETFTAGDVTVRRGDAGAASRCLRAQADMIICPWVKDGFSFRGV